MGRARRRGLHGDGLRAGNSRSTGAPRSTGRDASPCYRDRGASCTVGVPRFHRDLHEDGRLLGGRGGGQLNARRLRQSLAKDAIRPIYEPEFVPAEDTDLADQTHVVGLAINGEARAYPVAVLNFREMINDVVRGVLVLVTW